MSIFAAIFLFLSAFCINNLQSTPMQMDVFKEIDTNRDDKLSMSEIREWIYERSMAKMESRFSMAALVKMFDSNRDGNVSLAEVREAFGQMPESYKKFVQPERIMQEIGVTADDSNATSALGAPELRKLCTLFVRNVSFPAAAGALSPDLADQLSPVQDGWRKAMQGAGVQNPDEYDTNRDGRLSPAEVDFFRMAYRFKTLMDTKRDGIVTKDEFSHAKFDMAEFWRPFDVSFDTAFQTAAEIGQKSGTREEKSN